MEFPFSIHCTTCQSRLIVRKPSVLGQILACPKCGGMVLVERPDASAPPPVPQPAMQDTLPMTYDEELRDLPAEASSRLPVAERLEPGSEEADELARSMSETRDWDSDVEEQLLDMRAEPPGGGLDSDDDPLGDPPSEDDSELAAAASPAEPVAPPNAQQWTSPATRRVRQVALLAGTGLLGVLLAVVVLIWIASSNANPRVANTNPDEPPVADPTSPAPDSPSVDPSDVVPPNDPGDDPQPDPRPMPSDPVIEPPKPDPGPPQPDPKEPDPKEPDPKASDPKEPDPKDPAVPGDPVEPPMDPVPDPNDPSEPPGLIARDPAVPGVDGAGGGSDEDTGNLGGFLPFLRDAPLPGVGQPTDPSATAPSAAPATPSAPVRPPLPVVDVAARLQDPFLELTLDAPLLDFIEFLSQSSTIPISLDPRALAAAKLTPESPVHVSVQGVRLADVLKAGLNPLGLEAIQTDGHLVVTLADRVPREIEYAVDDLTGDDPAAAKQLSALVTSLVDPASWDVMGGAGTLTTKASVLLVKQPPLAQFGVVELLERLRVARGLPLKSDYDPAQFALETRREKCRSKLDKELLLNYLQPTLLTDVVDRIGREAELTLLVDWRAVADAGWGRNAEVTLSVDRVTTRQTLQRLLHPMGLEVRVIDDGFVQVTSRAELHSQLELELFRLDALLGGRDGPAELIQRIQGELGEGLFQAHGGSGVLQYDPKSKCLLALLAQPQHIDLRKALEAWKP